MLTSTTSTEPSGKGRRSSRADFHVSHSVSRGSAEARRMTASSGRRCSALSASPGPAGWLVRTFLASSMFRSTACVLTWKTSATKSGNRLFFRLQASVPRTSESASSSWLPTPGATDGERGGRGDLIQAVRGNPNKHYKLWPTPSVTGNHNRAGASPNSGNGLSTAVKLLPTPRANDWTGPGLHGRGGMDLRTHVSLLPTPTSRDHKDTGDSIANGAVPINGLLGRAVGPSKAQGSLSPMFVEWMMNFPLNWTEVE